LVVRQHALAALPLACREAWQHGESGQQSRFRSQQSKQQADGGLQQSSPRAQQSWLVFVREYAQSPPTTPSPLRIATVIIFRYIESLLN
jgi:hypothetical protein